MWLVVGFCPRGQRCWNASGIVFAEPTSANTLQSGPRLGTCTAPYDPAPAITRARDSGHATAGNPCRFNSEPRGRHTTGVVTMPMRMHGVEGPCFVVPA